MKKQKEILFRDKFRLLNSQDHSEDIKWSSTSSSEPESSSCNDKINEDRRRYCKRKRKKNVSKGVSNLNITFVDSRKNQDTYAEIEKSPILKSKRITNFISPILTTIQIPPYQNPGVKSPVLSAKRGCPMSPVLNLKTTSPKFLGNVRKKLCYDKESNQTVDSIKNVNFTNKMNETDTKTDSERLLENHTELQSRLESNPIIAFNKSDSVKSQLMVKVKNFFDSHFSSEHTSQNISTTDTTPSDSSRNEDVEILSCKTQTVTNLESVKCESVTNSDTSNFDRNIKKVKFKRGGLAFRLNALVKKQNAHISLWQHERFLASNSNFVIPKEEHIVFRIQNFDFQYGCYLLNAVDMDNITYLILINKKYMNTTIIKDSVLKLYEPFQVLSIESDVKIIVNVCKFECVVIKS